MLFNRNEVKIGNSIPPPSQDAIENTFNLRQVSLEDAARYGGSITREALGAMNFKGDRKNIIVDTKVHFLMPGMCPSIPGWHNDGTPRGMYLDPAGKGNPQLWAMELVDKISEPRYHLIVTGNHCPTLFLKGDINLELPDNNPKIYSEMTQQVNYAIDGGFHDVLESPDSTVLEWDWWTIHTAQVAKFRGWRYLIRVTETDHIKPRTNPADFIRTQNNVYSPLDFGW